ncbi:putative short-chain dehydrogenase [Xylaria sp. FL0933]|nr:putative short-chain dehydrogenase [Xylaria sp. FL0933]
MVSKGIVEQIVSKPELSAYYGLYTVRNATQAPALTSALEHGLTHVHDVLALDLTNLDNVRSVAEGIKVRVSAGENPPIRALILNAVFQDFGKQSWTSDGLDTTFAANYLGHRLLTLLLLESMDKEASRIIVIGSQAHDPNDPRNARSKTFEDLRYKTFVSDAASFEAIAKGLDADPALNEICVLGVEPGTMISGMQRLAPWFIRVLLFKMVYPLILYMNPDGPIRPTSRSAGDVLEAASGVGEEGGLPKNVFFDGRKLLETSEESRDPTKRTSVEGNGQVSRLEGA